MELAKIKQENSFVSLYRDNIPATYGKYSVNKLCKVRDGTYNAQ